MRIALVSLMALAAGANAFAQTAPTPTNPPAPPAAGPSADAAAAPPPPTPAPAPTPDTTPAPVAAAPPAASAPTPPATATTATPTTAPAAPATTPAPGAPGAPPAADVAGAPAPAPLAPQSPPPPPAPPTDPTAVALLNVLQKVCIPAANGGNFMQLAKTYGLRKNNDNNWTLKQKDFTLVVEDPGSNPTQCHVDVTHPLDPDSPGKPIIIALNDWAAVENGWSLYRNDKSVQQGLLFTTRSWQLDWNGKEQSLVFYTRRKPDGTPMHSNADDSQMIYGVTPSPG